MEVSMEYISRIICHPDVTPPQQSGLQVYMPAYILQIDVHRREMSFVISRLSKSWLNLDMNIHLNLPLVLYPCHFLK